jgi:Fe-S-cluster containining protein
MNGAASDNPTFDRYAGFFDELAALYRKMDRAYDDAAAYYGFQCAGCADNCCLTRFYHHTHLEHLYLLSGFYTLNKKHQERIRDRAGNAHGQVMDLESQGKAPRVMCPLNEKGACILYAYRPMICRLHGIPHELRTPGRPPVYGPGCAEFVSRCGGRAYKVFDRTLFYVSLADLERRFKEKYGLAEKFKKTISEFFL